MKRLIIIDHDFVCLYGTHLLDLEKLAKINKRRKKQYQQINP